MNQIFQREPKSIKIILEEANQTYFDDLVICDHVGLRRSCVKCPHGSPHIPTDYKGIVCTTLGVCLGQKDEDVKCIKVKIYGTKKDS